MNGALRVLFTIVPIIFWTLVIRNELRTTPMLRLPV